jgi:hypothetical protein
MDEALKRKERKDTLTERSIRFFNSYEYKLESVCQVLNIRLDQLASVTQQKTNSREKPFGWLPGSNP